MDSKALSVPTRTFAFILAFIFCLFLIIPQPAGAVSDPASWLAANALAGIIAGAAGSGIEIAVNGIAEDVHEYSTNDVREIWQDLLEQFAISFNMNLQTSFPAEEVTLAASGAILLDSHFAKNVKKFVEWLQSEKGVFSTGSKVLLATLDVAGVPLEPIPILDYRPTNQQNRFLGQALFTGSTNTTYPSLYASADNSVYVFAYDKGNDANSPNLGFYAVTPFYGTCAYFSPGNTSAFPDNSLCAESFIRADLSNKGFETNIGYYIAALSTLQFQYYNNSDFVLSVPFFSSEDAGFQAAIDLFEGNIDDGYSLGLVASPGVIRIPEVIDEVPVPIYVPGLPLTLPDAASYIIDNSAIGDLEASYTADVTLESQLPAPVIQDPQFFSFSLPSFDFGFDGIWDYVVDWVASLGSSLSLFFTIWNGLPYAMIVPVYASAVIVIVIGMYRRFFV